MTGWFPDQFIAYSFEEYKIKLQMVSTGPYRKT